MLIRNTSVLSFHDLSIRENTDVCIKGCRIKRVGHVFEPCGEIIDGSGCYLIPGLVNLHAHTAMTLLRGVAEDVSVEDWFNKYIWMYEKNLTPHDVYVGTLLGAAEMLLSGVTFVADHYFYMGEAAKAYLDTGMRADLAWAVFGVGDDWETRYNQARFQSVLVMFAARGRKRAVLSSCRWREQGDRTAHEHHRARQAICPMAARTWGADSAGLATLPTVWSAADLQVWLL